MAITGVTTPQSLMHGYSSIPLKLADTQATEVRGYNYIINIVTKKKTIQTIVSIILGIDNFSLITFATAHDYTIGSTVLLSDSATGYEGYYTIRQIPSTTQIVIDMIPSVAFTATYTIGEVLKYKMLPDPQGFAKIDLGNTIKDYVSQNLEVVNDTFAAPDTRYSFIIETGYEGSEIFNFMIIIFTNGNLAFVNNTITSISQTTFEIGDLITVQQTPISIDYVDSFGILVFSYWRN